MQPLGVVSSTLVVLKILILQIRIHIQDYRWNGKEQYGRAKNIITTRFLRPRSTLVSIKQSPIIRVPGSSTWLNMSAKPCKSREKLASNTGN